MDIIESVVSRIEIRLRYEISGDNAYVRQRAEEMVADALTRLASEDRWGESAILT